MIILPDSWFYLHCKNGFEYPPPMVEWNGTQSQNHRQGLRVLLTPLTCVHAGKVLRIFPGQKKEQTTIFCLCFKIQNLRVWAFLSKNWANSVKTRYFEFSNHFFWILCHQSPESPRTGALDETAKTPLFPIYRLKNAIEFPILCFTASFFYPTINYPG